MKNRAKNQGIVLASTLLILSGLADAQLRSGEPRADQLDPTPGVAAHTRFKVAPIPGVTLGTHDMPEYLAVPVASPVTLKVELPMPHFVLWTGAVETESDPYSSSAIVIEDGTGSTRVIAQTST